MPDQPVPADQPVHPGQLTAAPVSSGQVRRRRRTQRALQNAAIALVGRRGLAEVTVEEIAAAAGVSRRTFFNHFPTKAAALFDPDPSDAERLAQLLAAGRRAGG